MLLVALFRDPVDSATVARERARSRRSWWAARRTRPTPSRGRWTPRFGAGHPWGRATVGPGQTVARLARPTWTPSCARTSPPSARWWRWWGRWTRRRRGRTWPTSRRRPAGCGWRPAGPPGPRACLERLQHHHHLGLRELPVAAGRRRGGAAAPRPAGGRRARFLAHPALRLQRARGGGIRPDGGELRFQLVTPPDEAAEWAAACRRWSPAPRGATPWPTPSPPACAATAASACASWSRPRSARARSPATSWSTAGTACSSTLASLSLERVAATARTLGRPAVVFLGPILDATAERTGEA